MNPGTGKKRASVVVEVLDDDYVRRRLRNGKLRRLDMSSTPTDPAAVDRMYGEESRRFPGTDRPSS